MTNPTINEAKQLAYTHRKQAVLILSFEGGRVAGTSYGMNRAKCTAAGKVLDRIIGLMEAGRLPIPNELQEPAAAQAPDDGMFAEGGR